MSGAALLATARALLRLGYLGFGPDHPAVQRGAAFLLAAQRADGSWPLPGVGDGPTGNGPNGDRPTGNGPTDDRPAGERPARDRPTDDAEAGDRYDMMPIQTAYPLRGLAACGFATDPRAERAYDWLLAQRLPDGAWPTGMAAGNLGYVAGYRRLAHSRWGCRTNTTAVLCCLALHPERRASAEARRALDLLLGRTTRERHTLGFEIARLVGAEPDRGFISHHARFDAGLVLDLCRRVGATLEDERVADLVAFVRGAEGPYGLWDYAPRPQASRWVTFDLLRSLTRLDAQGDWLAVEPRTPFQAYPRPEKRF